MKDESSLLGIRLKMEQLISEREAMKAMNEWRASRGESQAYDEEGFFSNALAFAKLGQMLQEN